MYPTRLLPMAVPVTAGISAFGNWTVAAVSVLVVLTTLLAARSMRRPGPRHRPPEVGGS
jgi:hypothetical protein